MLEMVDKRSTGCYFRVCPLRLHFSKSRERPDDLPARCSLFSDLHLFVPRVPDRFVLLPFMLCFCYIPSAPPMSERIAVSVKNQEKFMNRKGLRFALVFATVLCVIGQL